MQQCKNMHITCRQPTVLSKEGKERRAIKMELKNVDITEGYVRGIKMLNTFKRLNLSSYSVAHLTSSLYHSFHAVSSFCSTKVTLYVQWNLAYPDLSYPAARFIRPCQRPRILINARHAHICVLMRKQWLL